MHFQIRINNIDNHLTFVCTLPEYNKNGISLCRRCDGQEFESGNDLPYHRHKRARICLVCNALMQGENLYTPALQYLCVLTTCDQHALPTIKQGHSEG